MRVPSIALSAHDILLLTPVVIFMFGYKVDKDVREDGHSQSWIIRRRYSNFQKLDRQIKSQISNSLAAGMPSLPPQRIAVANQPKFIESRCLALNTYLKSILEDRRLGQIRVGLFHHGSKGSSSSFFFFYK